MDLRLFALFLGAVTVGNTGGGCSSSPPPPPPSSASPPLPSSSPQQAVYREATGQPCMSRLPQAGTA